MRTLYFDCFAGASGNMILGALLGLGLDRGELERRLAGLRIESFKLKAETVDRSGISSCHVDVIVPEIDTHRHLHHIEKIINEAELSDGVKARAIKIFTLLAEAEARVHGIEVKKVHFHEVGALDAIIDIVGACIGFEMLGIEQFAASKLHVGSGFVTMAHGKFPVPPPAVAELLKGKPIYSTEIEGELITPTGAAIISAVCESFGTIPEMSVEATGYGAGTLEYKDFPNVLRLMVGEAAEFGKRPAKDHDDLVLMETNIDDSTPQAIGFVMERAFDLGALDCWFTPVQMKKNRPGVIVSVLASPESKDSLLEMLFAETTTIGVRISQVARISLDRRFETVNTRFGECRIKIAMREGRVINAMPEYEDVRRLALEKNVPFRIVWEAASEAAREKATAVGA
ncbi:MAG: nickel pincer cofactor biosynthesis protein LarC [Acidobacteria bacterium]|nr:nickel pincer cofactor biosynthesis protein LarC [Acidobacteriota bacterium]